MQLLEIDLKASGKTVWFAVSLLQRAGRARLWRVDNKCKQPGGLDRAGEHTHSWGGGGNRHKVETEGLGGWCS